MINLSIEKIAEIVNGNIEGFTNNKITGMDGIENAAAGELTFFYSDKYLKYLQNSDATCILIHKGISASPAPNQVFIRTDDPYASLVKVLKYIEKTIKSFKPSVHHSAIIGEGCLIDNTVFIGANVVIGDNCNIGANTCIYPNTTIYDNVNIGNECIINSNVSIYQDVVISDNCILHSGCVIGSDGFGFLENPDDGTFEKIPQLGNVELEKNVEIGANTTIDRALIGTTKIKSGTKIDNLVHIAHNCEIGENTGIAAQAGFSGSVRTGNRGRFGGQTGIAGHLEITNSVTLLAQSGVSKSITKSGVYFGSPAKEAMKAFKMEAMLRNLPEIYDEFKKNRTNK